MVDGEEGKGEQVALAETPAGAARADACAGGQQRPAHGPRGVEGAGSRQTQPDQLSPAKAAPDASHALRRCSRCSRIARWLEREGRRGRAIQGGPSDGTAASSRGPGSAGGRGGKMLGGKMLRWDTVRPFAREGRVRPGRLARRERGAQSHLSSFIVPFSMNWRASMGEEGQHRPCRSSRARASGGTYVGVLSGREGARMRRVSSVCAQAGAGAREGD